MASPLTFGQLGAFVSQVKSFTTYVERVQIFSKANDVPAAKHLSVFLCIVGGPVYTLLCNLLAPVAPKDKSLEDVIAVLKGHFEPQLIVIAERFHSPMEPTAG